MKIHRLKTWPNFYGAICNGDKPFEVRFDDRGIDVGDWLQLEEFRPSRGYTGRRCLLAVTYRLRLLEAPGIPCAPELASLDGEWVVLGLRMLADQAHGHRCHPDRPGSNDCPSCTLDGAS